MQYSSKPLHWGIVGTGQAAAQFAQGLHYLPETTLHAVASRQLTRGTQFAATHKIPNVYSSYEQMFEDPNIDIIYIATPPALHSQHCLQAIEKGKHIVCEKPFTVTAQATIQNPFDDPNFKIKAKWKNLKYPISDTPKLTSPSGQLTFSGKLNQYQFTLSAQLTQINLPESAWDITGTGDQNTTP